jgi:hypothetical protein
MGVFKRGRTLAAGLVVGALIGTGVAAVTPAGAAVKSAAASIDWKQVWKTEIKPRAKKTFYTKKASNKRYVKKTDLPSALAPYVTSASLAAQLAGYYTKPQVDAALGNYYTKTQSDANYYTKAQSDAKYQSSTVIRGLFHMTMTSGASGESAGADISYGVTLTATPTVHYILLGDPVPAGCLGTGAAPDAAPGNLCIFETYTFGSLSGVAQRGSTNLTASVGGGANFGTGIYGFTNGTGNGRVIGSWALRPAPGTIVNASFAGNGGGATGGGPSIDN